MEVNETRNCMVTDILLNIWIPFKNGKNQLFNSGGLVKWAYFQKKKVEYPFKTFDLMQWMIDWWVGGTVSLLSKMHQNGLAF